MARFYVTFDNSSNTTLDGTSTTYSFDRLAYPSSPNPGPGHKTAILNARAALSTQFYNAIEVGNRNGTLGITVPTDGYTIAGGTISHSNLYTNTEAVYNSDLRDRPQPPITVANSTAVSPADSWSIAQSYYTDCNNAFNAAMADVLGLQDHPAGGVYGRINSSTYGVYDKDLVLRSLWHDDGMNYFAWDDFTPGRPKSIAVNVSTTNVIVTGFGDYMYNMDRHAKIFVSYSGRIIKGGTPNSVSASATEFAAGSTQCTFAHGITGLTPTTDTWDQFTVTAYLQLAAGQGLYPIAFGSGSLPAISGGNTQITNQSGAINAA